MDPNSPLNIDNMGLSVEFIKVLSGCNSAVAYTMP